jgi:hypothetical protein
MAIAGMTGIRLMVRLECENRCVQAVAFFGIRDQTFHAEKRMTRSHSSTRTRNDFVPGGIFSEKSAVEKLEASSRRALPPRDVPARPHCRNRQRAR